MAVKKKNNSIFIDSGGFIASMVISDRHYKAASQFMDKILSSKETLVTSNLVIAETYPLIYRFSNYKNAIRFFDIVSKTSKAGFIKIIFSTAEHYRVADEILRKYSNQDLSLVDAVSFAIMRELKINRVFGFDSHFLLEGFILEP